MSDYSDTVRRHRRLAILRHLEACSGYASNASILGDVLAGLGLRSTRSQVITELTWLAENGFLTLDGHHDDFVIATATQDGVEIARGVTHHPEIQRPRPRG
ncbi:hypothetical protein RGUI_0826 [Rhodovulum sp. P5]|uniref:VpaChn25_0724 family phage protein n=1 Tax=Rhodovulum sp. P5 TaxID=1564506 RepID=UPI00080AB5C6|nr:hypothetical protein [Rhodovulum sp. P5]YP_009285911.1 hypothetical protein BI026_gp26 [Rhodovulum phage vB_RhkS_P1]ANT39897.1 hypothetical protein Rhks_26 [Rhodovulum phage vB_RhkS_P1]ARE38967.1 hypothetical protein RGUI_0826 [Rhodovulum sp. P5]